MDKRQYVDTSRQILRMSWTMSFRIFCMTLFCCATSILVERVLNPDGLILGVMTLATMFAAWNNRRAITEIPKVRAVLDDPELPSLRSTVIGMTMLDAMALSAAVATAAYLLAALLTEVLQ